MKFGVFFQNQVPRPWTEDSEYTVFQNHLEQARIADELGFDNVWCTEHHFLEEYSHNGAPEVFLAAVAAQTERIRIGHGVVVCVPPINHPIRIAERVATLDLISNGRVDVGTGRSGTWTEVGGFGTTPEDTKKSWDEYVRMLPRMWTEERFSHDGNLFKIPERAILPKPRQSPHPPMYVAVTSGGTEIDAAERGLGCLWIASHSFADQERRTAAYRKRIENCDPVGAVNNTVFAQNFLYCHEDNDVGAQRGQDFQNAFALVNSHLVFHREVYSTSAYELRGNLIQPKARQEAGRPDEKKKVPEGTCIGDPDWITAQLRKWEATGVDGINFLLNGADVLSQDEVLDSLRLFASEVMPKFK